VLALRDYKSGEFVPGTKVGFPGISKDEVRVNIIAYLKGTTV